ncbi:hypothetical protein [Paenibacillus campinasensis]|uniref:hypothetical protein n=1 Tax=Paenibacillus campinasensis TaxID=66347 RepID=UPI000BA6B8B7|nr:hypothetical protein [Paenibacillus campinasensis]
MVEDSPDMGSLSSAFFVVCERRGRETSGATACHHAKALPPCLFALKLAHHVKAPDNENSDEIPSFRNKGGVHKERREAYAVDRDDYDAD